VQKEILVLLEQWCKRNTGTDGAAGRDGSNGSTGTGATGATAHEIWISEGSR
jgi:hypothetical protein